MNDETRGTSSERSALGVMGPSSLLGAAFAVGVVGAVLVLLLTTLAEQSGPEGEFNGVTWSFRGNGALSVLFAGIPAVLGAGWVGLGLWSLQARHAVVKALATGGLLVVFGLIAGLAPFLFQASDYVLDARVAGVSVAVLGAAVLNGYWLTARAGGDARRVRIVSGVVALGSLGLFLASPIVLRLLMPLALPVAASAPVLAVAFRVGARGWLVGACLLVLVGILLGFAAFVWVRDLFWIPAFALGHFLRH